MSLKIDIQEAIDEVATLCKHAMQSGFLQETDLEQILLLIGNIREIVDNN